MALTIVERKYYPFDKDNIIFNFSDSLKLVCAWLPLNKRILVNRASGRSPQKTTFNVLSKHCGDLSTFQ